MNKNFQLEQLGMMLMEPGLKSGLYLIDTDLTDEEIAHYVSKYRPLDKAGAYGVQEWIGYVACTEMKGSYFNVMGFPVHKVYEMLKKLNIF